MNKLIMFLFVILAIGCQTREEITSRVEELPYYSEATFTPHWFENKSLIPDDFHQISGFSLKNQLGSIINEKSVEGKIHVVNFFFTACPGICPKMTTNMALVQDEFLDDESVLLLSHSVTPDYDSVAILKDYAQLKGVVDEKWHLLTGDRNQIYDLGRNQYFVEEDLGLSKDPDEFLHTENFVLVDQNRYIRGIYNGLNKSDIRQLIADIKTLKKSSVLSI